MTRILVICSRFFIVSQLLNEISNEILGSSTTFQDDGDGLLKQLEFIRQSLGSPQSRIPRLCLLIHNIDGANLRSHKVQEIFSLLATINGIHIVASIDHILAPLSECFEFCLSSP